MQVGPDLRRAVRDYVRAYASLHGRRKAAEDLDVSRHTLWRFLERGHMGRAVPSAVLSAVGGSVGAIKAATFEIIIDLEGLRPDPALRHLRQGLEQALLLLCNTPLATVEELSRFGRVPASTLRDRLKRLTERGLVDSVPPSRYGCTLCPSPGWLVRGRRYMACRPMARISRWILFRFTRWPCLSSQTFMRRDP